jgi:hypothetical protein
MRAWRGDMNKLSQHQDKSLQVEMVSGGASF